MATAIAVAFVVYSCKGKLSEAERINIGETPVQTVRDMFFVQTENGHVKMRVEAPVMERYDNDTLSYDLFPEGLKVFAYTDEGLLETTIRSDNARHETAKKKDDELWEAFGNVVVRNEMKQETMETDTLYWDRNTKEIWTDCYIIMRSPRGYMQGHGMRSDDMARNAMLMNPFDSPVRVAEDTTVVVLDTVNFIGPLLKNSDN